MMEHEKQVPNRTRDRELDQRVESERRMACGGVVVASACSCIASIASRNLSRSPLLKHYRLIIALLSVLNPLPLPLQVERARFLKQG